MDEFGIDDHKLIYHPQRVADWLKGENIYPIYAEFSLSGACNSRCIFCAYDFLGYKNYHRTSDSILKNLSEMAAGGLKSVMFAGEGEPLLHPNATEIIQGARKLGLDVAITSNATLLTRELAKAIIPHLSWFRASINAGTSETYAKIHRVGESEFYRVLKNLEFAAKIRNSCTIGAQIVVLPENKDEIQILAKRLADLGVDYLIVKPYSQHLKSIVKMPSTDLPEIRSDQISDDIKIIIRRQASANLRAEKLYKCCLALPFWAYVDTGGNVWGCSCHFGDEHFLYGNLEVENFDLVWKGHARRKSLEWVENKMNISECRRACRLDQINKYLWQLTHQEMIAHVNFI